MVFEPDRRDAHRAALLAIEASRLAWERFTTCNPNAVEALDRHIDGSSYPEARGGTAWMP